MFQFISKVVKTKQFATLLANVLCVYVQTSSKCLIYQIHRCQRLGFDCRINWNDRKLSKVNTNHVIKYVYHFELVNETCEDFCQMYHDVSWILVCFLSKTSFVVFQLILPRRPRLGNGLFHGSDDVVVFQ